MEYFVTEDECVDSESQPYHNDAVRTITDEEILFRLGVCRARIPTDKIDLQYWADELSQVTPQIMFNEGDGEYAFYRNIMEEKEFPFDAVLHGAIGNDIENISPVPSTN